MFKPYIVIDDIVAVSGLPFSGESCLPLPHCISPLRSYPIKILKVK